LYIFEHLPTFDFWASFISFFVLRALQVFFFCRAHPPCTSPGVRRHLFPFPTSRVSRPADVFPHYSIPIYPKVPLPPDDGAHEPLWHFPPPPLFFCRANGGVFSSRLLRPIADPIPLPLFALPSDLSTAVLFPVCD